MGALRDARILRAVANVRHLQTRAAEGELARANQERRMAGERLSQGRTAVDEAERGWVATTANALLDPQQSRAWLHALEARQVEERRLAGEDEAAAAVVDDRRTLLGRAQARSGASKEQARRAERALARQREEARLGAMEDQLNARRTIA